MQEFQNKEVSVKMYESPNCQVKLEVSLNAKKVNKEYDHAVKSVNKEVSIPGFRRGKAPQKNIEKSYQKYINSSWEENILSAAFEESMKLVNVYPFGQKGLKTHKLISHSKEGGAEILFEYESEPQVPEVDFKSLEIKSPEKKEVSDTDIEKRFDELRERYVDWKEVDKAVENGDFVDLDIYAIDQDPEYSICQDTRFKVDPSEMTKWMRNLIVGMKTGESVEGISELDDDIADEEARKNFKPTNCRIVVKKILERILPEVNEEFAKKLQCDSVDDFRNKIIEQLKGEFEQQHKNKLKDLAEEALLESYKFELPLSLIEFEREHRIRNRIRAMKAEKVSVEEIASKEKEIEEEVAKEVDSALRFFFLVRDIAKKNNIRVTDEEVQKEIMREKLYMQLMQGQEDFPKEDSDDMKSKVFSGIMTGKVRDLLVEQIPAV